MRTIGIVLLVLGFATLLLAGFQTGFYASPENRLAFNAQSQEEFLTGKTTGQKTTGGIALAGVGIAILGGILAGRRGIRWLAE